VPLKQIPGAAVAAMSLQFTVARAVLTGMIEGNHSFADSIIRLDFVVLMTVTASTGESQVLGITLSVPS
jgi:hypothetical protein